MENNLKKLNNNQIKATVELDQRDLKEYIDQATDNLGDSVEIKGFRKGRVPRDLIKKHVGQDQIAALALEIALEQSLAELIESNSLDVLNTSQLSIEKNNTSQLKYSVVLDLFPKIELADISKIKVKRQEVKIEEKEVDDTLEVVRNSRATFVDKNLDDQNVESGDRVEIDFEVKKDGQIIEGGLSKNHPLIIGGRSFIPGFEEQLVGMKKGEEKPFSLVAPEDYFYKDVAGKKLDFKVKINDIKKVITPEFNDNFAKALGEFASLNDLRKSIKEGLFQEKETKESQKLRLEILDKIIQQSKIDVPENLLNGQLDIMVSDFDHTLHEKGMELGLYLAKIGKTQEELKKDWTKDAEKQVKISLILRKIVKNLKMKASEEEIEEMTGQAVQAAIVRGEVSQADIDPIKLKENIASRIVNEKALGYIESNCVI
ncbi:MAG: trigger factor [Candidatus Yanofskybacteria bacterium RIFCSPHIGHO2_02_FULL_41_11]|uniref:Trigger factor n=1 Tax=Candidatus Yanofskybacteria bacterium RIFCSPHIGHO2_02_FULL_41_11 TaxID=1802675 RepID=A0A1F8F9P9_9BACT|nr:MAG: trigger factor [Candidatus Yanofskybacteria bacterium RIFCSPHIGHO2_02_FULL_41_11]